GPNAELGAPGPGPTRRDRLGSRPRETAWAAPPPGGEVAGPTGPGVVPGAPIRGALGVCPGPAAQLAADRGAPPRRGSRAVRAVPLEPPPGRGRPADPGYP